MTDPIVQLTKNTRAKGRIKYAKERLRGVYSFLGIPYAAPPIGSLRFQPTHACPLWEGLRDCTEFGPVCPQNIEAAKRHIPFDIPPVMDEDCLYLNIYSSNLDPRSKLPVMVWIHGGGFMSGFSNNFEGTALCNFNDVVVVSINYRLGFFGFAATGDTISGNMGLLDQVEALKWVQKHIIKFGGDPNNVTIFGESAGGMSCGYHIISEMSKGLFHRAICESGAIAFSSVLWPVSNGRKYLVNRLKTRGLKGTNEKNITEFLKNVSTKSLIPDVEESLSAVIDGKFITDYPIHLYHQGRFNKEIDVINGFNTHEGALFIHRMIDSLDSIEKARNVIDTMVDIMFLRGLPNRQHVKDEIIKEYFQEAKNEDDYLKGLIEAYGDVLFVAPAMCCALEHAKRSNGSIYMYHFTHKLPYSRYYKQWIGSDHLEEIPYVFGQAFQQNYPGVWTTENKEFSKNIMAMWCNFAATGNPNGAIIIEWPQHSVKNKEMMILEPNFHVEYNHEPERMYLWNEVIPAMTKQFKAKY